MTNSTLTLEAYARIFKEHCVGFEHAEPISVVKKVQCKINRKECCFISIFNMPAYPVPNKNKEIKTKKIN